MKFLMISTVSLIVILLVFSTVLFLKPRDNETQIIALKSIHTYAYTSDTETFTIALLISDNKSVYTIEKAITSAYIASVDSSQRIPITLEKINYSQKNVYDNKSMYHYNFEFKIDVSAEDLRINIEDAYLHINTTKEANLKLAIGEFNYTFMPLVSQDIILEDRVNMSETIMDIPTSLGLIVTINNQTAYSIEILNFDLNTSNVTPNMRHVKVYEDSVTSRIALKEALGYTYNPFSTVAPQAQSLIIPAYSKITYIVPFSYETYIPLHRYPIIIHYKINDSIKTQCFDDFSYIKTDPFFLLHPSLHSEAEYGND